MCTSTRHYRYPAGDHPLPELMYVVAQSNLNADFLLRALLSRGFCGDSAIPAVWNILR